MLNTGPTMIICGNMEMDRISPIKSVLPRKRNRAMMYADMEATTTTYSVVTADTIKLLPIARMIPFSVIT
jgi:hypothetical protein